MIEVLNKEQEIVPTSRLKACTSILTIYSSEFSKTANTYADFYEKRKTWSPLSLNHTNGDEINQTP